MKNKDLIKILQEYDKEAEVFLRDWNEEWAEPIADFAIREDNQDNKKVVYLG
jgi:hypothetical protein